MADEILELILFPDFHLEAIAMQTRHIICSTGRGQIRDVSTNVHISIIVNEVVELWKHRFVVIITSGKQWHDNMVCEYQFSRGCVTERAIKVHRVCCGQSESCCYSY